MFRRSLFGLALCYNKLPQQVVKLGNVKGFQRALQEAFLKFAEQQAVSGGEWARLFSVDWRRLSRTSLDALFEFA